MPDITEKIIPFEEIEKLCKELKRKGNTLVFTNGCFDILHAGHVLYLQEARALGDALILGLNSDASVKRLKGEKRPINLQRERALVLAGLAAVDYVCIFEEDTPYELIKKVRPDVLVKGGDWQVHQIVGSDIVLDDGGKVLSLSFTEGLSSSNIIKKIEEQKG